MTNAGVSALSIEFTNNLLDVQSRITDSIGTLSRVQSSPRPVDADLVRTARGIAIVDETQAGLVVSGAGASALACCRFYEELGVPREERAEFVDDPRLGLEVELAARAVRVLLGHAMHHRAAVRGHEPIDEARHVHLEIGEQ